MARESRGGVCLRYPSSIIASSACLSRPLAASFSCIPVIVMVMGGVDGVDGADGVDGPGAYLLGRRRRFSLNGPVEVVC